MFEGLKGHIIIMSRITVMPFEPSLYYIRLNAQVGSVCCKITRSTCLPDIPYISIRVSHVRPRRKDGRLCRAFLPYQVSSSSWIFSPGKFTCTVIFGDYPLFAILVHKLPYRPRSEDRRLSRTWLPPESKTEFHRRKNVHFSVGRIYCHQTDWNDGIAFSV